MANGLLDMFSGALGTTPPAYLEGLLGQQAVEDLRKRSIGSGLVNALVGYAAMPKNQNLGLGRILAGTAQAGMQGARGVYDTALQDYQTQAKIDEMARKRQQDLAGQQAINQLLQDPKIANDPMAVAFIRSNPAEALKTYSAPRDRKTATVGNVVVDVNTGEPIFTGQQERKTSNIDAGNKILVVDSLTGETIREVPKGLAPQAPKEAKPLYSNTPVETSSGFVYMPTADGIAKGLPAINAADGKPVANIMTKAQIAEQEKEQKSISQKESSLAQINDINAAVAGAKEILNDNLTFTSGTVGKLASIASAPSRTALEGYIDTLKANLSFETLAAMRANSPTGGALGSVSENELRLLGSTVASLDPNLPRDVLIKNLKRVEERYAKIKKAIDEDLKLKGKSSEKPATKTFNINGQSLPARLGSDGNYYVTRDGKTFKVEE